MILFMVVLTFESVDEIFSDWSFKGKLPGVAMWPYFMLHKVVLAFESVDEIFYG